MASAAVIGGGISGLTAAYYLNKLGLGVFEKVILLEASNHFGGWVKTTRYPDGAVHENGPRSIRPSGKAGASTLQLVDDVGLSARVLPIKSGHPSTKNRLIMVNNHLYPLPTGVLSLFLKSPPFSRPLCMAVFKDLFTQKKEGTDESMYSFAHRRLGEEIADYAIDPLCRGVVAGDAKEISVLTILRPLFEAEQKHGSITKGLVSNLADVFSTSKDGSEVPTKLVDQAKREHWRMWNLVDGLQVLPDTIASVLQNAGMTLHPNAPCEKITFFPDHVEVKFKGGSAKVAHVFASIPAKKLGALLSNDHPVLARLLAEIDSVSVATVNLEYTGQLLDRQAFGFLVPSNQKSNILGITFDSCNFPEHNGAGDLKTKLTVMMGGRWFVPLFGNPEKTDHDQVLFTAKQAIKRYLKIDRDPLRYKVIVQKDCIPQYVVGHTERLSKIRDYIKSNHLPLTLLGSSYDGISINDCIHNAKTEVMTEIASRPIRLAAQQTLPHKENALSH